MCGTDRRARDRQASSRREAVGGCQDAETTNRRTEARALLMTAQPVHIHTFTGIAFDLRDPRPEMVCLEDIVHSLSLMNRFNGAALFPYSVAQHSLHVAELLPPALRLDGLLHDAAEAYIGDMVSPLKQVLPEYKAVEARISAVVAEVFGLIHPEPPEVKRADLAVLAAEREQVLRPSYGPWFKDFPMPAPITIASRSWLEVKQTFAEALQGELRMRVGR